MAEGYGFGAEGDWKTAALVRAMKVLGAGRSGRRVVSWRITLITLSRAARWCSARTCLKFAPSLGQPASRRSRFTRSASAGRSDPVRLRFDAAPGRALNAALIEVGNRFRMLVNEVEILETPEPLPKLPVGAALWQPQPNLATAAGAWILAGGPHHTCLSMAVSTAQLVDFAEIAGVELLVIDAETRLRDFRNALRWNDAAWLTTRGRG